MGYDRQWQLAMQLEPEPYAPGAALDGGCTWQHLDTLESPLVVMVQVHHMASWDQPPTMDLNAAAQGAHPAVID